MQVLRAAFVAANKRKILEAARKFAQKGAREKALKEYAKLLKLDPRDAKLRLEIGDMHRRWGQAPEAVAAYSRVAEQFMKEGFDARAVAVYKQIQNLDPAAFSSYEPLAELYQRMGLTAEASAHAAPLECSGNLPCGRSGSCPGGGSSARTPIQPGPCAAQRQAGPRVARTRGGSCQHSQGLR